MKYKLYKISFVMESKSGIYTICTNGRFKREAIRNAKIILKNEYPLNIYRKKWVVNVEEVNPGT